MKKIRGTFLSIPVLLLANAPALWKLIDINSLLKTLIIILLALYTLVFMFKSHGRKGSHGKIRRLDSGAFVLGCGVLQSVIQLIIVIALCFTKLNGWRLLANALCAYAVTTLLCLSGIVRIAASARQVKILWYVILLFTWYIPLVNCIVFRKFYKAARSEYYFEQAKLDLDAARKENEICKTKYPILMVHGIFFRDWQVINYWGRVPNELIRNGAEVYYGKQQSSNKVSVSATEVAERIKEVIAETGAEKVNIIAHSKGGLDSRYAISHLGMDKYVATLTTINTPHYGCKFVDMLLGKIPESIQGFVDRKYNKLFTSLGDKDPSFLDGVYDLTYKNCSELNASTPDSQLVSYRSVMSKMNSIRSAGFPLNIGYLLNKPYGKGNDGLVTVESGLYGENSKMIEHKGKRGISHGDVIDLFRENIKDFDVREFYVDIVKELKEQGF